ncbi:MAG TPA: methyltransferase domain-containing protein [Candidatus Limnocylindria bacterium]|nr:methyltransferase domain-containing protein [Candidatus Limnocylindria bacterium]
MTAEIVERVQRSSRYRDVDPNLLERLAAEELPRARSADDAVKRVKRRLHQAVGAFRGQRRDDTLEGVRQAWSGDLTSAAFRAACAEVMRSHASTRERLPHLHTLYMRIWEATGIPATLLDVGCGLGPLALPWMGIGEAAYIATDVDQRPLETAQAFLELVGQPHAVRPMDVVASLPDDAADVALLLKLVPTLDRQDPGAAARLLRGLDVHHAVVSFPARSLGGRGKGMVQTYRDRLRRLVDETGRVSEVTEASVSSELVFVLALDA